MKENISIILAVLAIVFSLVAVTTSFVKTSDSSIGADAIGDNELSDNSVTSNHIVDGTITDDDISDISKIADESITLSDLASEVLAEMSGVVEILDNSILGSKLANASISNRHIADSAGIDPSKIFGTAWTAENDGSESGLDADTLDGIGSSQFVRDDREQTKYFTIPSLAFHPWSNDVEYSLIQGWFYNTDPEHDSHSYYAPVYIPDGAKLTKMTVRYYRFSENDGFDISLSIINNSAGSIVDMELPVTGPYTNLEIEIPKHYVDNYLNGYFVSIRLDPFDDYEMVRFRFVCIEYIVTGSLL